MFGRRRLQTDEAVIVAVDEIWERQPEVRRNGVGSDHLRQHPRTREIGQDDLNWGIQRAADAGWLMSDELLAQTLDGKWHGLRLSHQGLDEVAELTRPRWRRLLRAVAGDVRTVVVAAVIAVVSAVVTTVVLGLLG